MRDIFVMAVVFGYLPSVLSKPWVGIYLWSWLGYMNPHRLAWGFAYNFPFAYIVALTVAIGLFFSKEPKKIPWTRESKLLLILIIWMLVTTIFAFYPAQAWVQMEKVVKIQVMVFITMILITTRERINTLVWIIALSLGFYGVKGGIFTILHGGTYRVWGPAGSFIGGNNEIALALIMIIPLMRYLQIQTSHHWVRIGLGVAMLLTAVSVIGSQSRGALLGALAMGFFLWLKSRNKLFTGLTIAVAVLMVAMIMPKQWYERMDTIKTYDQDQSAMGRINAWTMAFNLAKDRPLVGGGFETFKDDIFAVYAPDPGNVHDAHSIYFEMLGEHGFVGLFIFLALGMVTWRTASGVIRRARQHPDDRWVADLAAMCQVSMIGYAVSGAFLGLSYFDLYYHLIALIVVSKVCLDKIILAREQNKAPDAADQEPGTRGYRRPAKA